VEGGQKLLCIRNKSNFGFDGEQPTNTFAISNKVTFAVCYASNAYAV
jgi:hypothetical protein